MRSLERDRDQDVSRVYGVAFCGIDADQVIPEARHDRLAHHAHRQRTHPGDEPGVEARLVALDPAEVAPPRPAPRVRRLLLRDVLEFRFSTDELGPQGVRARERGRAVAGVGDARLRDVAEPRRRRPLEVVLVRVVVALQLGVRHRRERIGYVLGSYREHRDGDRFVLIAPDAPQLGVRDVYVRGQVLLQLALGQVVAVQLLDLAGELGAGTRQVALPLGDVELTVGLKRGLLQHLLQDLRGRPTARRPDDLFVRDRDAETAGGALEQDVVNELIGDLGLDLLLVLAAQTPDSLLVPVLLEGSLVLQLERLGT